MKLKLQADNNILTLSVTESVAQADVLVLQAGLKKLAAPGKDTLIIDLSGAQLADPAVGYQVAALVLPAKELGLRLFVAGPSVPLSLGKTAQEALARLKTGISKNLEALWAEEATLRGEEALLKFRKAEAEKKLGAATDPTQANLQKENADLRIQIRETEKSLTELFSSSRKDKVDAPALAQRLEQLEQVVSGVLKQAGFS